MSGASADAITEDVVEYVIGFLSPDDLIAAMQVNVYWQSIGRKDAIWRKYIVSRWKVERPERLKRSCGTDDFYELYQYLDRNRYLPRGKYTTKQQIIWGKSRQEGADAWITVAHRPDCRVLTRGATTFIQLRVVVQNTRDQPLTIDLSEIRVRMKNGYMGKVMGSEPSAAVRHDALAPALLAVNGLDVANTAETRSVHLNIFEFAVVSINVECHGCEFEAEFLEGCSALWLPIRRNSRCADLTTCRCALIPDSYHRGNIRVPIVDESVIWRHYTSISGRFMVLDCRNSSEFPNASNSLFKSPTKSIRKTSIS
uniref:F-box domain-containing protein n=1 Tax=Globisporangium ultimum (strain ATCC 200006 / CBS 805.95 / DAOM BR144) TaxID=431595 RepID=K3WRX4_GLOUD